MATHLVAMSNYNRAKGRLQSHFVFCHISISTHEIVPGAMSRQHDRPGDNCVLSVGHAI